MIKKIEEVLKNTHVTPVSWLLGFSGIVMVRVFLEALSSPSLSGIIASDVSTLLHYYLYWMFIALVGMLFVGYALPKWRSLAPQLVLLLFVLIYIAPVVDFILSGGEGIRMAYIYYNSKDLLYSFLTFFGHLGNGATIGIRFEITTVLVLVGVVIQKLQSNAIRTVLFVFSLYTLIFFSASLPSIISFLAGPDGSTFTHFFGNIIFNSATSQNNLHGTLQYAYPFRALEIGFNFLMAKIWYIFSITLAVLWFFLNQKEKTVAIFKNSRPERVAAYLVAVFIGFGLAYIVAPPSVFSWNDFLSVIVLCLSLYFSIMFAICVNDLEDEEIDKISSKERPLIKGDLTRSDFRVMSPVFLVVSLIGAYLAGYYAFFCILTFTSLYYIYSAPPTKLKRIPFFSSLLIAFCALSQMIAGFFLISHSKEINALPKRAIVGIVIIIFLWSHIRDLKDVEGDRAAGISTVPVIFGQQGFTVVAIMASLAYLLVPLFTQSTILYISAIPGAFATYYYILKKPYRELPIFLVLFVFVAVSAILLFTT